jgi:hypothetical protein
LAPPLAIFFAATGKSSVSPGTAPGKIKNRAGRIKGPRNRILKSRGPCSCGAVAPCVVVRLCLNLGRMAVVSRRQHDGGKEISVVFRHGLSAAVRASRKTQAHTIRRITLWPLRGGESGTHDHRRKGGWTSGLACCTRAPE